MTCSPLTAKAIVKRWVPFYVPRRKENINTLVLQFIQSLKEDNVLDDLILLAFIGNGKGDPSAISTSLVRITKDESFSDPNVMQKYLQANTKGNNQEKSTYREDSKKTPQVIEESRFRREEFLRDNFKDAGDFKNAFLSRVQSDIVNSFIVDYKGRRAVTAENLTDVLKEYQNGLAKDILTYLNEEYSDLTLQYKGKEITINDLLKQGPELIYENEGEWKSTGLYEFLAGKLELNLPTYFYNRLFNYSGTSKYKNKFKAFLSYAILTNFDNLIRDFLGETIEFSKFGSNVVFPDRIKFSSKGDNMNHTWRDNEDIVLEDEVNSITLLLINTTPYYRQGTSEPIQGRYLNFSKTCVAIGRIKDLAFSLELRGVDLSTIPGLTAKTKETLNLLAKKDFYHLIGFTRQKPLIFFPALFDIIANMKPDTLGAYSAFKSALGFTSEIFDIAYSLHKLLLSSEGNSLNAISEMSNSNNLGYITLSMDSIFSVKFLQYYTDDKGKTTVRQMSARAIDDRLRELLDAINTKHSLVTDSYGRHKTDYNVLPLSEKLFTGISFNLGNIKVEVLKRGTVLFDGKKIDEITDLNQISEVYEFINEMLDQNFGSISQPSALLELLASLEDGDSSTKLSKVLKDMFNLAANILSLLHFAETNIKGITDKSEIKDKLKLLGDKPPVYNSTLKSISLIPPENFLGVLNNLATAMAIQLGLYTASLVKDGEGKSQSNTALSRLMSACVSLFTLQNELEHSNTKDFLLLKGSDDEQGGFLVDIVVQREAAAKSGSAKKAHKFEVKEGVYSLFVYDFVGGLVQLDFKGSAVGNGKITILASVNSDKSVITKLVIDLNSKVKLQDGRLVPFYDKVNKRIGLTNELLEWVISDQLGNYYVNQYISICDDWGKLLKFIGKKPGINLSDRLGLLKRSAAKAEMTDLEFLRAKINEYNNLHPTDLLEFIDELHYTADRKGNLRLNETIHSLISRFKPEYAKLIGIDSSNHVTSKEFWQELKKNVYASLVNSRFSLDLINFDNFKNSYQVAEDGSFADGDRTKLLPELLHLMTFGSTAKRDPKTKEVVVGKSPWVTDSGKVICAKVSLGPMFDLEGKSSVWDISSTYSNNIAAREIISRIKEYINNNPNAKIKIKGTEYDKDNINKLYKLSLSDFFSIGTTLNGIPFISMLLHPLIELYNYCDYLFSLEYVLSTVGSHVNHPTKGIMVSVERKDTAKHKVTDEERSYDKKMMVLSEEAARFNALHKRNVSQSATMHEFELDDIDGITTQYNMAVIEDIKDVQNNIKGVTDDRIKPYDGATFVNPFTCYDENHSLRGAAAGLTKKQFIHAYKERTGTGIIVKTAGFPFTNDNMRNMLGMEILMKKMTNRLYRDVLGNVLNDIDIFTDYNGNALSYGYASEPGQAVVYFKEGGNFYKRTITKVGDTGCTYRLQDELVTLNGKSLDSNATAIPAKTVEINTNYKLWKAFGGFNSCEFDPDKKLLYSEASIKNVVKARNKVGTPVDPKGKNPIKHLHQIFLPLKHADIHYLATMGAVKQGAANVNSSEHYYHSHTLSRDWTKADEHDEGAEGLMSMKLNMYQAGIQLDKEHHADGSELSLMTLVVSACALNGYTLDNAIRMYNSLASIGKIKVGGLTKIIKNYVNDPSLENAEDVREAAYDIIIKSLAKKGVTGEDFSTIVAKTIIEKYKNGTLTKEDKALPVSDGPMFRKLVSDIGVYVSQSGIKVKIPGILSVLTPSYNLFKLFGGRKLEELRDEPPLTDKEKAELDKFDSTLINDGKGPKTVGGDGLPGVERALLEAFKSPVPDKSVRIGKCYYIQSYDQNGLPSIVRREVKSIKDRREILVMPHSFIYEDIRSGQNLLSLNYEFKGDDGSEWSMYDLDSINDLEVFLDASEKLKKKYGQEGELLLKRLIVRGFNTDSVKKSLRRHDPNITYVKGLELNVDNFTEEALAEYLTDKEGREMLQTANDIKALIDLKIAQDSEHYNTYFAPDYYSKFIGEDGDLNLNYLLKSTQVRLQRLGLRDLDALSLTGPKKADEIADFKRNLDATGTINPEYLEKMKGYRNLLILLLGKYYDFAGATNMEQRRLQLGSDAEVLDKLEAIFRPKECVRVNGNLVKVDKASVKCLAHQVVMPKTMAEQFGFEQFDSVNEASKSAAFFLAKAMKNARPILKDNLFSLELRRNNGKHVYILMENELEKLGNGNYTEINYETEEDYLGNVYRLDSSGRRIYKVNTTNVKNGSLTVKRNDRIFRDENGNELIVTNNATTYLNQLHFNNIRFSSVRSLESGVINDLVHQIKRSKNKVCKNWTNEFTQQDSTSQNEAIGILNTYYNELSLELSSMSDELISEYAKTLLKQYEDFLELQELKERGVDIDLSREEALTLPVVVREMILDAIETHTSFLLTLEIIAARIPAQSMQSFMPMEVVAFDNLNINNAYVATSQVWLQGSDYDVDAVSLATFNVGKNGKICVHSPYALLKSKDTLTASFKLPYPTGKECISHELQNSGNLTRDPEDYVVINFGKGAKKMNPLDVHALAKYIGGIFLVNGQKVSIKVNNVDALEDLGLFLEEFNKPEICLGTSTSLAAALTAMTRIPIDEFTAEYIVDAIHEVLDLHNLFPENVSNDYNRGMAENSQLFEMLQISKDTANLMQASTSVDATTGDFKKLANTSKKASNLATRTPGNFANKIEAITENSLGKDCIAICATGLKSFSALTYYFDYVLTYGTPEQKARLVKYKYSSDGTNPPVTKLLANIKTKNPEDITNDDILEVLFTVDNDNDAALALSALLSLATDNAKELCLSKLNATSDMIGMYIYGIMAGENFRDVAKALMSDVGEVILNLKTGSQFGTDPSFIYFHQIFEHLEIAPNLKLFDEYYHLPKGVKKPSELLLEAIENLPNGQGFVEVKTWSDSADPTIDNNSEEASAAEEVEGGAVSMAEKQMRPKTFIEVIDSVTTVGKDGKIHEFSHYDLNKLCSKALGSIGRSVPESYRMAIRQMFDYLHQVMDDRRLINPIRVVQSIDIYGNPIGEIIQVGTINSDDNVITVSDGQVKVIPIKEARTSCKEFQNRMAYNKIVQLSLGAAEVKKLGQALGINKGFKANLEDVIKLRDVLTSLFDERSKTIASNIRRRHFKQGVLDTGVNFHTMEVDMEKFIFNSETDDTTTDAEGNEVPLRYRDKVINYYNEKLKHSYNIPEVIMTLPNYIEYFTDFGDYLVAIKAVSAKARFLLDSGAKIAKSLKMTDTKGMASIRSGIEKLFNKKFVDLFLKLSGFTFVVPKGAKYYNKWGRLVTAQHNITIDFTGDIDVARKNFTYWMENTVTPDLKKGITIHESKKLSLGGYELLENEFIQSLRLRLNTNNPSKNAILNLAPGCNMLPKGIEETNIFNKIANAFDALGKVSYRVIETLNPVGLKDLFFIYDIINNNNLLSQLSLKKLFTGIESSELLIFKDFYALETEFDKQPFTAGVEIAKALGYAYKSGDSLFANNDFVEDIVRFCQKITYSPKGPYALVKDENTEITEVRQLDEEGEYSIMAGIKTEGKKKVVSSDFVFGAYVDEDTSSKFKKPIELTVDGKTRKLQEVHYNAVDGGTEVHSITVDGETYDLSTFDDGKPLVLPELYDSKNNTFSNYTPFIGFLALLNC